MSRFTVQCARPLNGIRTMSQIAPKRLPENPSENLSESIALLSAGTLTASDRSALVDAILTSSETASLTKLGLRIAEPARHAASAMLYSAEKRSVSAWRTRGVLTGTCASLALMAVFSFTALHERGAIVQSAGVNPSNDRFGAIASFEGAPPTQNIINPNPALTDRFGGGGFEAN